MPQDEQVLRFAVGSAAGPRSRTWRLWVPSRKDDVYISGRRLGNSVKVSLHEPGPSRFALTKEWVKKKGFRAPEGKDHRLAFEWNRPRVWPPHDFARPLTILVPYDEVLNRETPENGEVVWVPPPPANTCVHLDVVYIAASTKVPGHPGAHSLGTGLVGEVRLENQQRVFVTWLVRPLEEVTRDHVQKLRRARILDADGKTIQKLGMLAFGTEPNRDGQEGTEVATLLDVTRGE